MNADVSPFCQMAVTTAPLGNYVPLTLKLRLPEAAPGEITDVRREFDFIAAEVIGQVYELGGRTNALGWQSSSVVVEIPAGRFAALVSNPNIESIDIFRTVASRQVE